MSFLGVLWKKMLEEVKKTDIYIYNNNPIHCYVVGVDHYCTGDFLGIINGILGIARD